MSQYYTLSVTEALSDLGRFDALIDVRSPAEFDQDHLPGAINWPVLDNQERIQVGTLYAQSPFEARKLGAAMVARNMARHLDTHAAQLSRQWSPLVYCWRGGQRSGSMNFYLGQIGFKSRQLEGGYKAFRSHVLTELEHIPQRFELQVLCGATGSGKTRLLHELSAQGAQVLDLEALAAHRGSVLGALPDQPQPSQKAFETQLWTALRALDPSRAVYVESESAKIGQVRVPESLHRHMRESGHCVWLDMPLGARVELLLQDYAFFTQAPELFCQRLQSLVTLRGKERIQRWQALAHQADWHKVLAELLSEHYDPGYERSLQGHYPQLKDAVTLTLSDSTSASMSSAASQLLAKS